MRSLRRSRMAAAGLFCLIALVVVGGMGWATVATLELAKLNLREQHRSRVLRAVTLMDSYMGGILNAESARPQSDYVPFPQPTEVFTRHGAPLNPADFRIPSPLLTPPHEWIDLYFHVEGGRWSSPHLPDQTAPWTVECYVATEVGQQRISEHFEWVQSALPVSELHERVARALDEGPAPAGGAMLAADAVNAGARDLRQQPEHAHSAEFEKRQHSHRASQRSYLPEGECVPAYEMANAALTSGADAAEETGSPEAAGSVESKPGEFVPPFWLEGPDGEPKLVFVREGTARDGGMFHEGFVADWDTLRPRLLEQVDHLFPKADVHPIAEWDDAGGAAAEAQMAALPAYLDIPDIGATVAATAWQSLRPKLLALWLGATAVLVVAGWGLRNLVQLTERRSQFAYSVTHELRTPLTTFRLYSDMLAAGLVPDESKQQYLETLNRESIRLSNLVEGVLEYARLENHRVRLNVQEAEASSLLHGIAETLEKRCADAGVTPRTDNAIANGQRVRTDAEVVNRIAAVLVNNACRHASSSKEPTVLVRLAGDNGQIHLDVIDSGPGIDRRDVRRIFRPFRRGHGADAAAQGGIGLGLALARSWARLLGGQLELFARHHPSYGGAHFRLTIPAARQG